jgi:hypothetical protein
MPLTKVLQTMPPDSFVLTRNNRAGGTAAIPFPLAAIHHIPQTLTSGANVRDWIINE